MMQARTKQIVALIAAVVLVAAAGLGTVVTLLVRNAPESLPVVTAYAHGTSVDVAGGACDAQLNCVGLDIAELHVPEGNPLQLSLPPEVADSNWRLNVQIGNPKTGEIFEGYRDYTPGEAYAVTVPGNEGEQLISAIIQLPAKNGLAQVWAFQTMPMPGGGTIAPAQ
ncbi:DUF2771 family protein [Prescottella subtropica]|uniref:DUF2771 family protein n=1 Tax=Prescottella subtropica TaxID=2545757 RepID=UPI0010F67ACE|nr:DUF2771 family protein [Prescottella subtropica]